MPARARHAASARPRPGALALSQHRSIRHNVCNTVLAGPKSLTSGGLVEVRIWSTARHPSR